MAIDDRRRFKRQKKQSIIHFQVVESKGEIDEDQEGLEAMTMDYSLDGMRFSTKEPIKKNTKIYIKLDSDEWGKELTVVWNKTDHSLLEMIGSVMWCLESSESPGEFEVGTRFIRDVEQ
jgi:hypothetical protein